MINPKLIIALALIAFTSCSEDEAIITVPNTDPIEIVDPEDNDTEVSTPTIASATAAGSYTVETMLEADGLRNGPDYAGSTIYYPSDATTPLASIVIVPGFLAAESSIQEWGAFYASHGIVTMTIGTNNLLDQPETRATALLDALVTLKEENTRTNSPLNGKLDMNRFALSGWSMGGGGAQLAVQSDPSIKAIVALCPWLETPTTNDLNHSIPLLILSSENDLTAAPAIHANVQYNNTPSATDKLMFELDNGNHFSANSPSGGNGELGRVAISWLKVYLEEDTAYRPLLFVTPESSSNYETNLVAEEE